MNNDFVIPVVHPQMKKAEHNYPISPRENLLRAFRHEKPAYMPCLYQSTQFVIPSPYANNTQPIYVTEDSQKKDMKDWFGINFVYEDVQEGFTPMPPYVLDEIGEWREKIQWPDLKSMDWESDLKTFKRDENLALACRCLATGTFEQLHFIEGFEQGLVDLLMEPEECKDFLERYTDFKIELFHIQNDLYHFDYACHNDDWAHARGPFFSYEAFEEVMMDAQVRLAKAIKDAGCYYMFHMCGKMEAWLPYLVDSLKADLIEIQNINDTQQILDTYGDRLTVEYCPDAAIMYNPATTAEQAREYARSIVDQYGAHVNKGSGIAIRLIGNRPESYYAFEDELYHYSLEKYKNL